VRNIVRSEKNLVWIDLEMTGLIPESDVILEAAVIITNSDLEPIGEELSLVIHQPREILNTMNNWCQEQHTKSGLINAVESSTITLEEAEQEILVLLDTYCVRQKAIICGNSIFQDRAFIHRWMPRIDAFLNYRIVDVSSIREVIARWFAGDKNVFFKKQDTHRALSDIRESIAELQHYRTHFFHTIPVDED